MTKLEQVDPSKADRGCRSSAHDEAGGFGSHGTDAGSSLGGFQTTDCLQGTRSRYVFATKGIKTKKPRWACPPSQIGADPARRILSSPLLVYCLAFASHLLLLFHIDVFSRLVSSINYLVHQGNPECPLQYCHRTQDKEHSPQSVACLY